MARVSDEDALAVRQIELRKREELARRRRGKPADADEREAHKRELRARTVAVHERQVAVSERRQELKERAGGEEQPSSRGTTSLPRLPKMEAGHGEKVIIGVWVAGLAVISWQEIKANKRPPDPRTLVGWTVTTGILELVDPLISAELASVMAVGLLLGLMFFRQAKRHGKPGESNPGSVAGQAPAANPITPAQPGEHVTNPPAKGTGFWWADVFHKTWDWTPFMTAEEVTKQDQTDANGFPLTPPSNSPNWMWNPSNNAWIDTSMIKNSNDPIYNPSVAPSARP